MPFSRKIPQLPGKVRNKMSSAATLNSKQAGGGVTEYTDPASFQIKKFEPIVLEGLKEAYKHVDPKAQSFEEYLKHMASEQSRAMGPAVEQDISHPLSNYFISSSHNTYLTGHQLYGKANVDGYRNVLLRGCRSVEVDVWDGEPPSSSESSSDEEQPPVVKNASKPTRWRATERVEPVVLHGYTATKDVSFRRVCETIREQAFVTSKLPVCVSLEVHACHEQQEIMVEILEETFGSLLVDPARIQNQQEPTPKDLLGKILIKVKYAAPKTPEDEKSEELSKAPTQSSTLSDDDVSGQKDAKPSKIIESLSNLGTYIRGYSFKSLDHPDAKVPFHIFSLSEGTLSEVHKDDPVGLFEHNKKYFMRAYPKGTRISSSNLDPAPFWRQGVQMVALNWQRIDTGMMLNEAMYVGTGGWVLKPPGLRSSAKYPGVVGGHDSNFTVQFIAGQNIPTPEDVEPKELKLYIKCELHLEIPNEWENLNASKESKSGEIKDKTKPVKGDGANPDFKGQALAFKSLPAIVPELCFVKFKIMHDKLMNDPLAAWACIRLDRLRSGYRFIHLFDAKGVQTKGVILAKFDFNWALRDKITAVRSETSQQSQTPSQ